MEAKITKVPRPKSMAEEMLALHIRAGNLPKPNREYRFSPVRQWRFDFAWPDQKVAVEVDGVTGGAGGRHQRMCGFEADCEKLNAAAMSGWLILRFTPNMIKRGVIAQIEMTLTEAVLRLKAGNKNE